MAPYSSDGNVTLCSILRDKIREYKRSYPDKSSSQIAKSWGLGTSTFNRIENLEISRPNFDQMYKVLNGCNQSHEVMPLGRKFFPEEMAINEEIFEKEFGKREPKKTTLVDELKNIQYLKIIFSALSSKGLALDSIKENFGSDGENIVDQLIKRDILCKKENGRIGFKDNEENYKMTYEEIQKSIILSVSSNHFENEAKYHNGLFYYTETVNAKKIMPLIHDINKDAADKIMKLMNDPKNSGDDLVYSSFAFDCLI